MAQAFGCPYPAQSRLIFRNNESHRTLNETSTFQSLSKSMSNLRVPKSRHTFSLLIHHMPRRAGHHLLAAQSLLQLRGLLQSSSRLTANTDTDRYLHSARTDIHMRTDFSDNHLRQCGIELWILPAAIPMHQLACMNISRNPCHRHPGSKEATMTKVR